MLPPCLHCIVPRSAKLTTVRHHPLNSQANSRCRGGPRMISTDVSAPTYMVASVAEPDQLINALSGGLAGAITATFVCPLDVLKTRMQIGFAAGATSKYSGVRAGLAHIVKTEGVIGLYRGLQPTLLAMFPNWAVYFTVYEKLKASMIQHSGKREGGPMIHTLSAAGAGASTIFATNPLFVVKTRLQTQHMGLVNGAPWQQKKYKGTFHALRSIAKYEGLSGLYSGLGPSLIGIAHVAIQFPLYEASKQRMARRSGCSVSEIGPMELIVASAFSKMIASTATYPHEVVRSHMHVSGSGPFGGIRSTCLAILREDGIRGFYRGCLTNLLRTTPAAALTFTSFELITRSLHRLKQDVDLEPAQPLMMEEKQKQQQKEEQRKRQQQGSARQRPQEQGDKAEDKASSTSQQ